jgi:hypothetical protein
MQKYETINALWRAQPATPITREEANRAAKRIARHFGHPRHGSPNQPFHFKHYGRDVRRCWISRTGRGLLKGWPRLVHDISHDIFALRHPSFRPHEHGHDALELEIAQYVLAQGWLAGTLRSKPRAKPDRREHTLAAIARWERKAKRAATALRKLRRRLARIPA